MSNSATNSGLVRMSAGLWTAGYVLFLLILLAAPFPLGSNREWAWAPLAIIVSICGLLLAAGAVAPRRVVPVAPLLPVVIAFVLLISWALLTAVLPVGPGGASGKILESASSALNQAAGPRISARADATLTGLLRWLTYALVFWLAVHFASSIARARAMLVAILLSGVGMTVYSMLANTSAALKSEIAALLPTPTPGDFTGTFVNYNHYATFAGICALVAATLVRMDIPPRGDDEDLRSLLRRVVVRLGSSTGLYLAASVLMVAGAILSGSRGGALSLAVGLLVAWFLGRRRSLWVFAGAALALIGLLALPGGLYLISRFFGTGLVERQQLYELSNQSILLRPWTGWGLGSFESLYLIFQPTSLALFFDRAHNTYLELMVELGIPFGLVLPAIVTYIVARCGLGVRERLRNQEVPALAVAATALVGVHALVDFSLQIPAVAIAFAAILGIGWAQSWSSRR